MAIKTYVAGEILTAASTNEILANSGLVYVSTVAMTTATTNIDGCFTSTYDNYRVIIEGTSANAVSTDMRIAFRTSGVTNNTAIYYSNILFATNITGPSWAYVGAAVSAYAGVTADVHLTNGLDIFSPKLAKVTSISAQGNGFGNSLAVVGNWYSNFNAATVFDGMAIRNTNGDVFTATCTIYGYRKA